MCVCITQQPSQSIERDNRKLAALDASKETREKREDSIQNGNLFSNSFSTAKFKKKTKQIFFYFEEKKETKKKNI